MAEAMHLVPGRECGDCMVCCIAPPIVGGGLRKLPGILCEHGRAGGGCAIHARRPQGCRDYHCLWRGLDMLDESWRPDRSGILMQWARVSPDFPADHAVDLILVGPAETLRSDAFAGLAGGFIASGTATYLQISNGPDFFPARALLNRALAAPMAAGDYDAIKRTIWSAYGQLRALPRVPATIEDYAAIGAAGS